MGCTCSKQNNDITNTRQRARNENPSPRTIDATTVALGCSITLTRLLPEDSPSTSSDLGDEAAEGEGSSLFEAEDENPSRLGESQLKPPNSPSEVDPSTTVTSSKKQLLLLDNSTRSNNKPTSSSSLATHPITYHNTGFNAKAGLEGGGMRPTGEVPHQPLCQDDDVALLPQFLCPAEMQSVEGSGGCGIRPSRQVLLGLTSPQETRTVQLRQFNDVDNEDGCETMVDLGDLDSCSDDKEREPSFGAPVFRGGSFAPSLGGGFLLSPDNLKLQAKDNTATAAGDPSLGSETKGVQLWLRAMHRADDTCPSCSSSIEMKHL